jgi:serine/threonine-protein kinase RsbW/non-specific serine/threonine protein kinase
MVEAFLPAAGRVSLLPLGLGWTLKSMRWTDYITPSTLQLAPLMELLLEPLAGCDGLAQVQLGLHEVLVNAVRHGNGCDPAKCLRIRRILTRRWVVWQVQDQGEGVPPQQRLGGLPDCLDAPCGRGIFLIHHCFDDVRWSPRGNRLQVAIQRNRLSGRGPGSPDP